MVNLQHGDVLIKGIGKIPEGVKAVLPENDRWVIAKGEATGHNHTIVADKKAILYELKDELYLEVLEPVTIVHEEHKPLPIPEGIYQIGRVQEYDYLAEMSRPVVD